MIHWTDWTLRLDTSSSGGDINEYFSKIQHHEEFKYSQEETNLDFTARKWGKKQRLWMDENSACCSRSIRPTKGLSPSCSSDSSSVSAKPKPSTTLCAWRRGPLACAENSSIEPIFESLIPYSFTHAREIWWSSLAIFNQAAGGWLRSSKETPNCPFVLCLPVSCLSLCLSVSLCPSICLYHAWPYCFRVSSLSLCLSVE